MQIHVLGTLAVPVGGDPGDVLTQTVGGPDWLPGGGGGGTVDDEQVRDIVGALLVQGANITITVDDVGNQITLAVSGLTKSTVGLGSVDNTSDADKPISTAVASALGSKASTADLASKANLSDLAAKANDTAVVHKTGAETIAGVKTFSSAPVVPDGSFAIAKVSGLVAALAAAGGGIEGIASLVRLETTPGVYPARGTARQDLSITFRGTQPPPIAAAGSGTNWLTSGTAMDNLDVFDLVT